MNWFLTNDQTTRMLSSLRFLLGPDQWFEACLAIHRSSHSDDTRLGLDMQLQVLHPQYRSSGGKQTNRKSGQNHAQMTNASRAFVDVSLGLKVEATTYANAQCFVGNRI